MATVQERRDSAGAVKYRVQIRLRGYPPESATFDRKTDAKQWAQRVESDMRAGRYVKTVEARRHTFGDMIDRYMRDVLPAKRRGTREVQSAQFEWWKNRLGDYLLADITPAMIGEQRDELAAGVTHYGTKRSPATVSRYLAALGHCFTVALKEWGWVEDNPVRKVTKPREPKGRVRFLSDEERARLLDSCRQSQNPCLHAIVVIALSTGMRKGEILNLTWDRIDFDRDAIVLLPEDTKNASARVVPLVGRAREVLEELRRTRRRVDTDLVFPSINDGDGHVAPLNIRNAWQAALERAEIQDFRFHDLRHSAASYLAMNGATLVELAEILGHKTLQMVKRYAHLTEAHTGKVMERMNRAVFGD